MSIGIIFSGLACGMLLVGRGIAIWSARIPPHARFRITTLIRWIAGSTLLIGALASGRGDVRFAALAIMATLAVLPLNRRSQDTPSLTPALLLTGLCLAWAIGAPTTCTPSPSPILLVLIAAAGGLGAQAFDLKEDKSSDDDDDDDDDETSQPNDAPAWMAEAAFVILTVTVGGVALANLWRWGVALQPAYINGLVGAWLAWVAAWTAPRHPLWLPTALHAMALVWLILFITQCP